MQKLTSDIYIVEKTYPLDQARTSCLQLLYQPVIGFQAVSLYLFLQQESFLSMPSLHSRLTKCTGMTLSMIEQSLIKLEAIGLLKTYRKQESQITYIYQLQLPISPKRFYDHQILNVMLLKRLPKEEYQKTKSLFLQQSINKENCKEITSSFNEVFDLNQLSNQQSVVSNDTVVGESINSIENEYDMELFYKGLQSLQINKSLFTKKDITLIQQTGTLYRINALDMQVLVKDNIINNALDHQHFINDCRNHYSLKMPEKIKEVYTIHPSIHKSQSNDQKEQEHISYLENISPYRLLKDKFGGKEPLKRDLQLVESMLIQLGLEAGVVNVLLEYTLAKCDGALQRSFMEFHGGKWKRKKIITVKQAIDEARESMQASVPVEQPQWVASETITIKESKNVEDEDLEAILAKFD